MEHHLDIQISASYHTLYQLTDKTRYIWFCCHGQGQLAEYFIKKFEGLKAEEHFIIAPQGLSKYYLNGFAGRVGASWMTSEDRITEIENQQVFLKSIWEKEVGDPGKRRVILFGFSQGVATISRFAAFSKIPFDQMILWAGGFAHDISRSDYFHLTGNESVHYFTSREDPFFQDSMIEKQRKLVVNAMGIEPKITFYHGGHKVMPDLLPDLLK